MRRPRSHQFLIGQQPCLIVRRIFLMEYQFPDRLADTVAIIMKTAGGRIAQINSAPVSHKAVSVDHDRSIRQKYLPFHEGFQIPWHCCQARLPPPGSCRHRIFPHPEGITRWHGYGKVRIAPWFSYPLCAGAGNTRAWECAGTQFPAPGRHEPARRYPFAALYQ